MVAAPLTCGARVCAASPRVVPHAAVPARTLALHGCSAPRISHFRPQLSRSAARAQRSLRRQSISVHASLAGQQQQQQQQGNEMGAQGMRVLQRVITLKPDKEGIYLMTNKIVQELPELKSIQAGTANLFLKSTDAALSINENADPTVRTDLDGALERVVAGAAKQGVNAAVAKTSLVGVSMDIPIQSGKFALGTWQGLYLCDFTGAAGEKGREIVVTLMEAANIKNTKNLTVQAPSRGCHLTTGTFTGNVVPGLAECDVGLLNLHIKHTSASLTINENADPTVRTDLEAAFNHIAPESWNDEFFEHTMEGPDDMPAHVKSTLVGASLSIPVNKGTLQLGTWQGVYLNEHRNIGGYGTGHARDVTVTLQNPGTTAHQRRITVQAPSRGCHDITDKVLAAVGEQVAGVETGVMNLFIQHTSASLTCASVADGEALETMLNEVVPERWNREFFKHTYEGDDDMPGHVKSTLMGASLTLPLSGGKLALGEGQGILLCEHRNMGGWGGGHQRSIVITVQGQ